MSVPACVSLCPRVCARVCVCVCVCLSVCLSVYPSDVLVSCLLSMFVHVSDLCRICVCVCVSLPHTRAHALLDMIMHDTRCDVIFQENAVFFFWHRFSCKRRCLCFWVFRSYLTIWLLAEGLSGHFALGAPLAACARLHYCRTSVRVANPLDCAFFRCCHRWAIVSPTCADLQSHVSRRI